MARIKENSRYKNSTITDLVETTPTDSIFMVLNKFPNIPLSTNDGIIKITEGNKFRPDLISQIAYGDTKFGWAIMMANNIRSFASLSPGLRLRVPDLALVKSLIKDEDYKIVER